MKTRLVNKTMATRNVNGLILGGMMGCGNPGEPDESNEDAP